jgi:hypothetical protein
MKMKSNDEHQLSLNIPSRARPADSARCTSRQRRLHRAGLWFQHMRRIVDHAPDPAAQPVSSDFSQAN